MSFFALGFQAHALLAAEDHFPDLRRQVLGQVAREPRGLFLLAGDLLAHLGQSQALLVAEEGGDADVQSAEQDADRGHLDRGIAPQRRGDEHGDQQGAAGRYQQGHAEQAQAADDQRGEAQNQQEHQAGHHGEAEQRHAQAAVHGVHREQDAGHLARVVLAEALAEVVRQVRVEQRIGHHPEDAVAEILGVGSRRDAGATGDIGQHARIVFTHGRDGPARRRAVGEGRLHALERIPVYFRPGSAS